MVRAELDLDGDAALEIGELLSKIEEFQRMRRVFAASKWCMQISPQLDFQRGQLLTLTFVLTGTLLCDPSGSGKRHRAPEDD